MKDNQRGLFLSDFEALVDWEVPIYGTWKATWLKNVLQMLITSNWQPMHYDPFFARKHSPTKQILTNGYMVLGAVVGLTVSQTTIDSLVANKETRDVKHLTPVHLGDVLMARALVTGVSRSRSKPQGVVTLFQRGVRLSDNVDVISFARDVVVRDRG